MPQWDASGVAALLFGEDHITEIKLNDDRMGLLVMTRDREQFARALGKIALNGHRIESVVPADENVDALYEYLIGGESILRERSREAPGSPDRWNSGVPSALGAPSRDGRQEC